MRIVPLIVCVGCWSSGAPKPAPAPPPPVETGPFQIVLDRAGRCDQPAVEHAGKIYACEHAWDARTGIYAGRGRRAVAVLGDGRMISVPELGDGFAVDGKQIERNHIYKPALSPDGKHFAYLVEHFTPDYHQTIAVRETATFAVEYEVAKPRFSGESYTTALGWLGERLYVTVVSPSCSDKNPCSVARIAEVTPRGVAGGPDQMAQLVGFAPDGSAIAIADRTRVRVYAPGMPLAGDALATLDLAAAKLASDRLRELAVAPAGRLIAINNFDDHGAVIYERSDRTLSAIGTFPNLIGSKLVFSRAGDALYATGTTLAVVRRSNAVAPPLPPLSLDGTGFDVEDCADAHPHGFYCNTDHQLRLRLETPQPYETRVEIHVSPASEFVAPTLDAWTAMLRSRFEVEPRDITEQVDLGLRSWQTPRGRQLEFHHQIRQSCRPADAFTRFAEVDGLLWRVTIEVPPESPQATVDPLLARLIDGWLGPPQPRIARQMPAPPGTTECATF